jgi:hypothetical protein
VTFDQALADNGFEAAEQRETHALYRASPNRFLTYSVHAYRDGTALFTWEFAAVDYLATRGIVLGSSEALNTFMFPADDEVGPQDAAWLTSVVDRAEALLGSLDFADPEG